MTTMVTPTPLGHLGWSGRCSGPANSPKILSRKFQCGPGHERGRRIDINREAVRPWRILLLGQLRIRGGPGTRFQAGGNIAGQPGRNVATSALVVLLPGQPILHGLAALCLLWRASHIGPPSLGRVVHGRLLGTALRVPHADGVSRQEGVTPSVWQDTP